MYTDVCALILLGALVSAGADSSAVIRDSLGSAADSLPLRLRSLAVVAQDQPGAGRVVAPAGVTVDAFGKIYVTDVSLHRLQR